MAKLPPFTASTRKRSSEEGRQPDTRAKYREAVDQIKAGDISALTVMADPQVAKCANLELARDAIEALLTINHMTDLDINGHRWYMAAVDQASTYWHKGLGQSLSGRTSNERLNR